MATFDATFLIALGGLVILAALIPRLIPRPSTPMGWFWAGLIICNFFFLVRSSLAWATQTRTRRRAWERPSSSCSKSST
jgi:hypothetical protein